MVAGIRGGKKQHKLKDIKANRYLETRATRPTTCNIPLEQKQKFPVFPFVPAEPVMSLNPRPLKVCDTWFVKVKHAQYS